ncbi:unnamed protein product [Auanema sp. JU1783]|nr:unnamed protein product [Auanema sp. JU1783]
MARIPRPCRSEASIPIIEFRKPFQFLLEDVGWSRKNFYDGTSRDIMRENIRAVKLPNSKPEVRRVPAFTIQSRQNNTKVIDPPEIGRRSRSVDQNHDETSQFRLMYSRGDLPVAIDHNVPAGGKPKYLRWVKHPSLMKPESITYLLSKFSSGLPIIDQPYRNIAEWAIHDLLDSVPDGNLIVQAIPQMVRGIRASLYSFDNNKRKFALELLNKMTRISNCGPLLVPFYRQLLPPLRQVRRANIKEKDVLETKISNCLQELERTGGPSAFINIKYVIPTYDSCVNGTIS